MADYIPEITMLLPQREPFIMVDRLLYADKFIARTSFRVISGNPLVSNGYFTGGGLLENIAQTAAAGEGYMAWSAGRAVSGGFIISVSKFLIAALPKVGDELFTVISHDTHIPDIIVISGRVICREAVIATCDMKILTSV
jgi:3-hydroxymyristoyl/3-hydroxydecanoyl-(acyl carrier protein) dehydratase